MTLFGVESTGLKMIVLFAISLRYLVTTSYLKKDEGNMLGEEDG